MNSIYTFEAYSLKKAKELTASWKNSGAETRYDDIFGEGVNRLYIPLPRIQVEDNEESVIYQDIKSVLIENGYAILSYKNGTASKEGDSKNIFKIGKLLNRFSPDLKKQFDSDPDREGAGYDSSDLLVCISRHAYDIGGMSTGRGWTSCMNLDSGSNNRYVKEDIKKGTLVAYLITKNDKNIKNPIGRLNIKPHTSGKETALYPEEKVYGTNYPGFRTAIISWLNSVQPVINAANSKIKKYKVATGLYNDRINPDGTTTVEPLTHLGAYEFYTKISKNISSIKDADTNKLGAYNVSTNSIVIKAEYNSIKSFGGNLILARKETITKHTYKTRYYLFTDDGTSLLENKYNHLGYTLINKREFIYAQHEDGTDIYEYHAKLKQAEKILDFEGHMGMTRGSSLLIGNDNKEKLCVFDCIKRKLFKTTIKMHYNLSFIKDKSMDNLMIVGNPFSWYHIPTKRVLKDLKGYEAIGMGFANDDNKVRFKKEYDNDFDRAITVNVLTGEIIK